MTTTERARHAIEALRAPDASLARVPNTVRQSIAEVIEALIVPVGEGREPCECPKCGRNHWHLGTPPQQFRTATIVLPSGYATAEEFAKDCGFELSAAQLRAEWTDDYVKLLQRQVDEWRADVMSGALASPPR